MEKDCMERKMEKLTERDEFGNADIIGVDSADLQLNLEFEEFNKVTDAVNRLAGYEELEEQGKLVRLPCSVGDRVYVIDTDERLPNKEIKVYDIDNIVIANDKTILLKYDAYDGVICELENIVRDKPYLDFYRCFLSQEEAEARFIDIWRRGHEI